jgi:long-chain fatty acid transport protein
MQTALSQVAVCRNNDTNSTPFRVVQKKFRRNTFMKYTKIATAVVAVLGMGFSLQAYATNGMNPEGTGVKNRGMGGAGVALANEAASVTNNPAAVVAVGDRMDVALGIFSPKPRSYTLTGNLVPGGGGASFNASQESGSNTFAIPFFGMTFPIDKESAWAIVANANGGMNTDYATNFGAGVGQTGSTGINLAQLFVNATYGRTISKGVDVGATAILAYQTFEAKGLGAFASASRYNTAVSDVGTDSSTGLGFKLGIRGDLGDGVTLGAAYQSKISMKAFDKYKGLFADQGKLDIAPTLSAGVAWKASPKATIAFDYLRISYGDVAAIGNSTSNFNGSTVLFGDSGGPGFGWDSINVYKLGVEYGYDDAWTLRAGWNHGDNPIKPSEVSVNFLAPGVIKDHLTFGGTYKMDKASELSFNFVHAFKNTVTGDFNANFGAGSMTIEMSQNYVEMGYSKLF